MPFPIPGFNLAKPMRTINLIQLELQYLDAIIDGLADLGDLYVIVATGGLFPQLIGDILIIGLS